MSDHLYGKEKKDNKVNVESKENYFIGNYGIGLQYEKRDKLWQHSGYRDIAKKLTDVLVQKQYITR